MLSILTQSWSPKSVRSARGLRMSGAVAKPCLWGIAGMVLMSWMIAGCGNGSTSEPKAGPITTANQSGVTTPSSALSIGSRLQLSMTPSGDVANAGVDWEVTCGGNPTTGSITNGACGTFHPRTHIGWRDYAIPPHHL